MLIPVFNLCVSDVICYELCGIGDSHVAGQPREQLADH